MTKDKLALFPRKVVAIVPPPLTHRDVDSTEEPLEVIPVLGRPAQVLLLLAALGLIAVFLTACWLNPYEDGAALRMETHRQLGLPPCTFKEFTGLPCPSCGLTTSFALLIRGDVVHSLRANAVGTLMASFCLALIPWCLASVYWRRPFFLVSIERALLRVVLVFVSLLLIRWVFVVGLVWWQRHSA